MTRIFFRSFRTIPFAHLTKIESEIFSKTESLRDVQHWTLMSLTSLSDVKTTSLTMMTSMVDNDHG